MKSESAKSLSVIVPIAPGEESWRALIQPLAQIPTIVELVLSAAEAPPADLKADGKIRWITGERGRAEQQNLGAQQSTGTHLWFLHADSSLPPNITSVLQNAISSDDTIYYFDLKFDGQKPAFCFLNEIGARIRSDLLKLPFGDQGFLLSRDLFFRLGSFCESAPYGEDHLLIWQAHKSGVAVRRAGAKLGTSARKYSRLGWGRTTSLHLGLTAKQAIPELWDLFQQRICGHE